MVLFSRGAEYDEMQKITQEYYKRFNNVLTIYYLFSGEDGEPYLDGDFLYLPGKESYLPGILDKTMATFSYVWKNYPNYDYYIRTNASTIVDINMLIKHVNNESIEYGGGILHIRSGHYDPPCGIDDDRYSGIAYVWGTAIFFSNHIFKKIVDHSCQIDRTVIDDVSIGKLAKELEIKATPLSLVHSVEFPIIHKPIIYRNHSDDRNHDIQRMREIVKRI